MAGSLPERRPADDERSAVETCAADVPSGRLANGGAARVAIVSVTYNRCDPLLCLLEQIRQQDYPADRCDVFLVDNASSDDTVERVRREQPGVELIVSPVNEGTSAGFNRGMRAALGRSDAAYDYVWLLDSDAEIAADTLRELVAAMAQAPEIGIIGSTIYDPGERGRVVARGLHFDWGKGRPSLNKSAAHVEHGPIDVDLVPACSLMVRSKVCREIGLWDERFWVYWGDTDWCRRVLGRGYRVCSHERSRAWHRDWANTPRGFGAVGAIYDDLRGGLLFNLRYAPPGSPRGLRHMLLRSHAKAAVDYLGMRGVFSSAVEAAVADFLRGDFDTRNYAERAPGVAVGALDSILDGLRTSTPGAPRILLTQFRDDDLAARVESVLRQYFPRAVFTTARRRHLERRRDFTTDVRGFLGAELGEFCVRLFSRRHDIVVADIAMPHLYTLIAARQTLMIESTQRGALLENRRSAGFRDALRALLRGLTTAYVSLPLAMRRNARLRECRETPLGTQIAEVGRPPSTT